MSDEKVFLDALRKDPDDDDARLVYADWLEERGDVRAEYLRLEYQLPRVLRRLAELQAQLDPAWLKAVGRRRKVVLVSCPPLEKIQVIKVVREVTGLGLKESKDLVESTRPTIKDDLTFEEAEQLAKRFHGIAVVAIESSTG
jgi:uncharacterized protein (TIGR02996 family)